MPFRIGLLFNLLVLPCLALAARASDNGSPAAPPANERGRETLPPGATARFTPPSRAEIPSWDKGLGSWPVFSPDGKRLLGTYREGKRLWFWVWDWAGNKEPRFVAFRARMAGLYRWLGDGRTVIVPTSREDGGRSVIAFDLTEERERDILSLPAPLSRLDNEADFHQVELSPDESTVAASLLVAPYLVRDKVFPHLKESTYALGLWERVSGQCRGWLSLPGGEAGDSFCFSPDGRELLWSASAGKTQYFQL